MADFYAAWFRGFEDGMKQLEQKEKEIIYKQCARSCADTGVIELYKKLYKDSDHDLDIFFSRLNELESINGGTVISPGKIYEVSFQGCLCDLVTMDYIKSDDICECSRQSVLYVMETLEPERVFRVERLTTVLMGDRECRFRITRK